MITGVIKNFASLTAIRVVSRVLEFLLRVYLIREVLSEEIVAQLVTLDLILTSSLHIAKACLKPGYQQVESNDEKRNVTSAMNLMTFGVGTTIISAIIICSIQWSREIDLPYISQAIFLYGICSLLESLKEKYSVQLVLTYQYRKIALIELFSYLPKTLFIFIASRIHLFEKYGILVFGVGQLIFVFFYIAITFSVVPNKTLLLQKLSPDGAYLDPKSKKVVKQLSYISFLKLLLQEFEKIVLVVNNTIKDSSIYSIVGNLGSIIVRFVFAPLEEISYNYYARGSQAESLRTFLALVKGLGFFSILCICYGFRYAENVLHILFGERWVSTQSIFAFKAYLVLLSIMGFNGTIQAFVLARADPVHTIPKFKYFTIFSTLCYFGSSLLFLRLGFGAAGLFMGNTCGMAVRICISWNIQAKKHIGLGAFVKGILPGRLFFIILLVCIISSIKVQQMYQLSHLYDFGLGVILFGFNLIPILLQYREPIAEMLKNLKKKNE